MAMGRCAVCDKLVPIAARGPVNHPVRIEGGKARQFVSHRQLAWHPVRHLNPSGTDCDGHTKEIT